VLEIPWGSAPGQPPIEPQPESPLTPGSDSGTEGGILPKPPIAGDALWEHIKNIQNMFDIFIMATENEFTSSGKTGLWSEYMLDELELALTKVSQALGSTFDDYFKGFKFLAVSTTLDGDAFAQTFSTLNMIKAMYKPEQNSKIGYSGDYKNLFIHEMGHAHLNGVKVT
jgi:hypothetical protein